MLSEKQDKGSENQSGLQTQQRQRNVVADWNTIRVWKDNHGLTLSINHVAGSFIAVLAPLLPNSLIDLTKILPNFGG